jgi:peroxiredoxin
MDGGEHPFPATYVIGKDGQVHYEFVGRNYVDRAPIEDVLNALRSLEG